VTTETAIVHVSDIIHVKSLSRIYVTILPRCLIMQMGWVFC